MLCGNVSTKGCDVRVVGGSVARSAGTGSLTTTFKSWREGFWFPSTGLRYLGCSKGGPAASSTEVHTDNHKAFLTALPIWEGGGVRAALVVDPCTEAERSGQSAWHPPEARAARLGRGTPLRTIDEAVHRLGIANSAVLRSTRFPTACTGCPSL